MVFMGRTNINDTDGLLESLQAFCFSKKKQINNRQKHDFIKITS